MMRKNGTFAGPSTNRKKTKMTKTVVLDIERFPIGNIAAKANAEESSSFPSWPLHQIACVSMLTIHRDNRDLPSFEISTYSRETLAERGIIQSVERDVEHAIEVLSYNGRAFDIPFLMARAAVTAEPVPTLVQMAAQLRIGTGVHTDLLQEISGYGAAPSYKLTDICAAFSIPAKTETHGSDVASLVQADNFTAISNYCETDVIATWLVAEHWRSVLRDAPERWMKSWTALSDWIAENQPELEHLQHYLRPSHWPTGGQALSAPEAASIYF